MSELNYKELQEQGVFDVPYRAFEFMQKQQSIIDEQNKRIDELNRKLQVYEKHVHAINFIHLNQFDQNTDSSFILGNLDGFFECLEDDLKCEAKQT